MKKNKVENKYIFPRIVIFLSAVYFLSNGCSSNQSYEEIISEEMGKEIRNDSIINGIHFGMNYVQFIEYCTNENKKGKLKPNSIGTAVEFEINHGFDFPVLIELFPSTLNNESEPLSKFDGVLSYKNFSHYNKNMDMKNLVRSTIRFFESGYGGRKFIAIPNDNLLTGQDFVKVDANRKIVLKPVFSGNGLQVEFEDLKPLHKSEPW